MNWTPEKDARLRTEWATGDSADDIARRLGREFKTHLTKNAIIGRAHHIPLPRRRLDAVAVEVERERCAKVAEFWNAQRIAAAIREG